MQAKLLQDIPEGQLLKLQDGTVATKTGEVDLWAVLTEATTQQEEGSGFQFYHDPLAVVYTWEEE